MKHSWVLPFAAACAALGWACSSGSDPASSGATSASGSGGTGGSGATTGTSTVATTGATTTSSTAVTTVSSTTGVGGSTSVACDPPAAPDSLYAISDVSYAGDAIDPVQMCKYRGDVILIVNTAAL